MWESNTDYYILSKSTNHQSLIQYWLYTDMSCNAKILASLHKYTHYSSLLLQHSHNLKWNNNMNLGNLYDFKDLKWMYLLQSQINLV